MGNTSRIGKTVLSVMLAIMVGMAFTVATAEPASAASFKTSKKVMGIRCVGNTYNTLTIKWNKFSGAKSYRIYRATSKKGKYKKIGTSRAIYYKSSKLTTGKTYYYKVKACSKAGGKGKTSKYSSALKAVPTLTKPSASVKLSGKTATVKWKKVSGAKGYQVYRKTGSGKYSKVKTTSGLSFKNSLGSGKTYTYKVRAYRTVKKKNKYSAYSKAKSVSTSPAQVTGLKLSCSSNTITISWSKVSGATKYMVYRSTGGSYSKIATTTKTSYKNGGLTKGKTYYYKVRAYSKGGYGSYSSAKSCKVPAAKPADSSGGSSGGDSSGGDSSGGDSSGSVSGSTDSDGAYRIPAPAVSTTKYMNEDKTAYLEYAGAKIWIGEQWTNTVNSALNSGKGAVNPSAARENGDMECKNYIYIYGRNTKNFLMVHVVGNSQIAGWETFADNMGFLDGTPIKAKMSAATAESLGDEYSVNAVPTIEEAMSTDSVYPQNTVVMGGINDNEAIQETSLSSTCEERLAEEIISAVRMTQGLSALKHNDDLYTYGTFPYATTMALSKKLTHDTDQCATGPLAGKTEIEREDIISSKTNDYLLACGENAAEGGTSLAEAAVNGWYTSSGHKANFLKDYNGQLYTSTSVQAVAVVKGPNGLNYWAWQSAGTKK